jgi:hypothetical protein
MVVVGEQDFAIADDKFAVGDLDIAEKNDGFCCRR